MASLEAQLAALSGIPLPADLWTLDHAIMSGLSRAQQEARMFKRASMITAGAALMVGAVVGGIAPTQAMVSPATGLQVSFALAPSTLLDPGH